MFDVTVEGLDSLDKDLEEFSQKVDKAIPAGLKTVLGDFTDSLASHVQTDVYEAYAPIDYERTGAMGDKGNMTGDISGNVLNFLYEFSTEMKPVNKGRYYQDSDDVIRAVQDSDYLWFVGRRNIPERPFWDNFVSEQLIGGQAEMSLARGMNAHDPTLQVKATKGTTIIDGDDTFGELHGAPQGSILNTGEDEES